MLPAYFLLGSDSFTDTAKVPWIGLPIFPILPTSFCLYHVSLPCPRVRLPLLSAISAFLEIT